MRSTVHETQAVRAGIADFRPVGVLAPAPVRLSATHRARVALSRSGSAGPARRRRPLIVPAAARVVAPVVGSDDTVVVSVVRPPRLGAGGGARARPATTLTR